MQQSLSLTQPQTPWKETSSTDTDPPATSSAISEMTGTGSNHGAAIGAPPQKYQDHISDLIDHQAGAAILNSFVQQDDGGITSPTLLRSSQDSSPWADQSPKAATTKTSEPEIVPLSSNEECNRNTNDSQDGKQGDAEVYWIPFFHSFYSND